MSETCSKEGWYCLFFSADEAKHTGQRKLQALVRSMLARTVLLLWLSQRPQSSGQHLFVDFILSVLSPPSDAYFSKRLYIPALPR